MSFLIILLNSCSKSPDIDPRDQYIGDYDLVYTAVGTTASGKPVTINQAEKGTVVKGTEPNQVSIIFNKQYITVIISGSNFTLIPIVSPVDKDYVTNGFGFFTKNSFTLKSLGKGGNNYPTEVTMTGTKR